MSSRTAMLLVLILAMGLTACGGEGGGNGADQPAVDTQGASEGSTDAADASGKAEVPEGWDWCSGGETQRVAMVYIAPLEQQWNSRIHKALAAAEDAGCIEYTFAENVAPDDEPRVMEQYAADGYDLVMGDSFTNEEATREMAARHPQTAFLIGSSLPPTEPNYSVFDNYIQDPSYLCGMVTGAVSESGKIGVVAGFPVPEVNRLINAFAEGAKETNPEVSFTITFINSWFDPPKTTEAAFAQLDSGADIIYAERAPAVDAAKERGKFAVGNVVDVGEQYPDTVLCSSIWHFEPTLKHAIERLEASAWQAEDYARYSFMINGGSELSSFHGLDDRIPEDVKQKVEARQQEIMSGEFVVEIENEKPQAK